MFDKAALDAFLHERPYYDRRHVVVIATLAKRAGIPFCPTCLDWHYPTEDHSS